MEILTAFLTTFKEGLEAFLLLFSILLTRGSKTEHTVTYLGIVVGIVGTLLLGAMVSYILTALELSMIPLTLITVAILFYLSANKHNKTGNRTRILLHLTEGSLPVLSMAAGLIVLREGIEVILATSGIVNTNPMGVILGSLLAIITLLALSNPIARLTSKINKKYIFQFCNWSFILMALYYLYEVVAQISVA